MPLKRQHSVQNLPIEPPFPRDIYIGSVRMNQLRQGSRKDWNRSTGNMITDVLFTWIYGSSDILFTVPHSNWNVAIKYISFDIAFVKLHNKIIEYIKIKNGKQFDKTECVQNHRFVCNVICCSIV